MDQGQLDSAIQDYYASQFNESARLTTRSTQGRLEFIRVQELIAERIAPASHIVDVGGATGVHAAPLAELGHRVTLIDPVESQVLAARESGTFEAVVGDARRLDLPTDAFDVALLFGPLYHLGSAEDRQLCLREAARVVRPGGLVFCSAIPRLVRHAALAIGGTVPRPYPTSWVELLAHGTPVAAGRFPGGHFHTSEELEQELAAAGLGQIELHAIEGVGGLVLGECVLDDSEALDAALTLARRTGHLKVAWDLSNHLMAIGRVSLVPVG